MTATTTFCVFSKPTLSYMPNTMSQASTFKAYYQLISFSKFLVIWVLYGVYNL